MSAFDCRLLKPPRARFGTVMMMVAMMRARRHEAHKIAEFIERVKPPALAPEQPTRPLSLLSIHCTG
jgi:hypothetical protein